MTYKPFAKWFFLAVAAFLVMFGGDGPLYAQDSRTIEHHSSATYRFGQIMEFTLSVDSSEVIREATLIIEISGQPNLLTAGFPMEPSPELQVKYDLELASLQIQPFSRVTYWWQLVDESGETYELEQQSFLYRDDRFNWKEIEQNGIVVHWTGEDSSPGLFVLDLAQEMLPELTSAIPGRPNLPLHIYLYPTSEDIQTALRLSGRDWLEAHARPEAGTVMVPIGNPLSAEEELARSVPHELSHLLLYQATDGNYADLPRWFDEGVATSLERGSNGSARQLLETAIENGDTIAFHSLCKSFPTESEQVALAYAQSGSLVNYLRDELGDETVSRMIVAIANGATCLTVTDQALGLSLDELTQRWLEHENPSTSLESVWQQGAVALLIIGLFAIAAILLVARSGTAGDS